MTTAQVVSPNDHCGYTDEFYDPSTEYDTVIGYDLHKVLKQITIAAGLYFAV